MKGERKHKLYLVLPQSTCGDTQDIEGERDSGDSRDRSFSSRRRALATFLRPPLQTPAMSWWSRVCLYLMAFTQPRPTMHSAPLSAVFSSLSSRRTDADAATGHPPVSRATSFYDLFQCRENERTDDAEERIGGTETRAPSWNGTRRSSD